MPTIALVPVVSDVSDGTGVADITVLDISPVVSGTVLKHTYVDK